MKSKFYFYSFIFLFFINISQLLCMEKQELICPICNERIDDPDLAQTLPCNKINPKAQNHTFHMWCIDPWLLDHSTCPACRTEVGILGRPKPCCSDLFISASFNEFNSARYNIAEAIKNKQVINTVYKNLTSIHLAKNEKLIKLIMLAMLNEDPSADINPKDNIGQTPLHNAVREGSINLVEFIVEKLLQQNPKANINPEDSCRQTPLHVAFFYGRTKIAKFLINVMLNQNPYANINPSDFLGDTPLHSAVHDEYKDGIELIINITLNQNPYVNINSENTFGLTPLYIALKNNFTKIAAFIEESLKKQKEKEILESFKLNENIKYFRNQNL